MNRLLILCGVMIMMAITQESIAYDIEHLKRLLKERECYGCNLRNADLRALNLIGANLSNANLSNANLTAVNLAGANLSNANLSNANLLGANIIDVNLTKVNLTNTNFTYANLAESNFTESIINNTNFTGANLINSDFTRTKINNSQFQGANLTGVKGMIFPSLQTPPPPPPRLRILNRTNRGENNNQDLRPEFESGFPDRSRFPSPSSTGGETELKQRYRIPPWIGMPTRFDTGGTRFHND
jgi:hypothetical protein